MKKLLSAAALAASFVLSAPLAAHAAAYATSDPAYDLDFTSGNPSSAQRAQADLVKVSYWNSGDRMYFRWQVRDLRSDIRLPSFNFGKRHRDAA